MSVTYPNESPAYRSARNDLLTAELELRAKIEEVAALRRSLPQGGAVADYQFTASNLQEQSLSDLFGPHDSLALYSLMYAPGDTNACGMCVSLLDGLNAQAFHIKERMSFAVVAAASPDQLARLSSARGWSNLKLLSAQNTNYQRDYHAETDSGSQLPILNVFQRKEEGIFHFWGTEGFFADVEGHPRHVDGLWPLWNMLDLSPEGRGADWYPALSY